MIKGFKIFNSDFTNRYGQKFEVDKEYVASGDIVWGTNGNGFHFCTHLEDCFRYYDAINDDCIITQVSGSGKIKEYNDEYYGYYDMYVSEILKINKILTRKEILEYLYDLLESNVLNYNRIKRFIRGYKLTTIEIEEILNVLIIKDKPNMSNYVYYLSRFQNNNINYQKFMR